MIRLLRTLLVLMLAVSVSTTGLGAMGAMAMTRSAATAGVSHDHSSHAHDRAAAGKVHKHSHDNDGSSSTADEGALAKVDGDGCLSGKSHGEGSCCAIACHMAMIADMAVFPFQGASGSARVARIEPGLNPGMLTRMERPPRAAGA